MSEVATPEGTLTLEDVLRFLQRNALLLLAGALGAAVLAGVLALAFDRPVYTTTALLEVDVDPGEEGAGARRLPARGYQQLARSTKVMRVLRRSLTEQAGTGEPGPRFSTSDLSARLVLPERWESDRIFLIELEGRAPTAQQAAQLVNTWARTLIKVDGRSSARAALEAAESTLDDRWHELESRHARLAERIEILRRQRESVAPVLSLRTVSSDPTPVQGTTSGERPVTLVTEQPNPLYIDLTSQLNTLEVELANLEPELRRNASDLARVRSELERTESEVGDGEAAAGAPPGPSSDQGMDVPEIVSVSGTNGVSSFEPGPLVRRALSVQSPIRLMARAPVPERAHSARLPFKVLAAAVGGAMLAFLVAVGREALRVKPARGSSP